MEEVQDIRTSKPLILTIVVFPGSTYMYSD